MMKGGVEGASAGETLGIMLPRIIGISREGPIPGGIFEAAQTAGFNEAPVIGRAMTCFEELVKTGTLGTRLANISKDRRVTIIILELSWPYICQAAKWSWKKTKEGAKIAANKAFEVVKAVA